MVVKRSEQNRLRPVSFKNGISARHQLAGEQQSRGHTVFKLLLQLQEDDPKTNS